MPKFSRPAGDEDSAQLVLVASDGELCGHHQKFRDKFLACLMDGGVNRQSVEVTFPAPGCASTRPPRRCASPRPPLGAAITACCAGREAAVVHRTASEGPFRQALDRLAEAIDLEYLKTVGRACWIPGSCATSTSAWSTARSTCRTWVEMLSDPPALNN
jgi:hypothetical protein